MMWRLSLLMERRRRLASLATGLALISLASIMITDLRFYVDKIRDRTPTGDY